MSRTSPPCRRTRTGGIQFGRMIGATSTPSSRQSASELKVQMEINQEETHPTRGLRQVRAVLRGRLPARARARARRAEARAKVAHAGRVVEHTLPDNVLTRAKGKVRTIPYLLHGHHGDLEHSQAPMQQRGGNGCRGKARAKEFMEWSMDPHWEQCSTPAAKKAHPR